MARTKASKKGRARRNLPAGDSQTSGSSSLQRSMSEEVIVYPPSQKNFLDTASRQSRDVKMLLTPPTTEPTTNTQLPNLDAAASATHNISSLLSPLVLSNALHPSPLQNLLEIENVLLDTPHNIYQQHLASKGRGIPLWIPEGSESLHIDYRREGLSIGDVIMLTAYGGFSLLFNICQPSDHPYNIDAVPEGFSPLNPPLKPHDVQRYESFGADTSLTSDSVVKDVGRQGPSGIHFRSSAAEGAILALPNGAMSQELVNTASLQRYIADNIVGWYKYAKEVRGWKIQNGDLRVVVGVDKSTSWGMATFASRTETRDVHLQFRRTDHAENSGMYHWEYEGMVDAARAGPSRRQIDALIPPHADFQSQQSPSFENQCLFVRTLNTNLQDDTWDMMESKWISLGISEGSGQFGYGRPSSSNSATGSAEPDSLLNGHFMPSFKGNANSAGLNGFHQSHPSNIINKFLLAKHPNAKLSITDDRDWIQILKTTDAMIPSDEEMLRRLLASSYVALEENGIVHWNSQETSTKDSTYDLSTFPSPNAIRSVSVNNIEDLPPYVPCMGVKSQSHSTPGRHARLGISPPPYRSSFTRARSDGYLFSESPQRMETDAISTSAPDISWHSALATPALKDIVTNKFHECESSKLDPQGERNRSAMSIV